MCATHRISPHWRCDVKPSHERERENESCFGADSSARDTPQSVDDEMRERGEEPHPPGQVVQMTVNNHSDPVKTVLN